MPQVVASVAATRPLSMRERLRLEGVRPYELAAYLALFPVLLRSLAILLLVAPSYERTILVLRLDEIDLALQPVAVMYVVADGRSWLPGIGRGLHWLLRHHS